MVVGANIVRPRVFALPRGWRAHSVRPYKCRLFLFLLYYVESFFGSFFSKKGQTIPAANAGANNSTSN